MTEQVEIHVEQGSRGRWRFKVVSIGYDGLHGNEVVETLAVAPVYGYGTEAGATAAAHRFIRLMRQRSLLTMKPIPVRTFDRMDED